MPVTERAFLSIFGGCRIASSPSRLRARRRCSGIGSGSSTRCSPGTASKGARRDRSTGRRAPDAPRGHLAGSQFGCTSSTRWPRRAAASAPSADTDWRDLAPFSAADRPEPVAAPRGPLLHSSATDVDGSNPRSARGFEGRLPRWRVTGPVEPAVRGATRRRGTRRRSAGRGRGGSRAACRARSGRRARRRPRGRGRPRRPAARARRRTARSRRGR